MSSFVDNHYLTLEEFLESQRSPILPKTELNFDSSDTPPPFVDAPEGFETVHPDAGPISEHSLSRQLRSCRVQPSLTDALLIRQLGPQYDPAIATQAGTELCCEDPDVALEDRTPDSTHETSPMISGSLQQDVCYTSDHQVLIQQALTASRRASEKLNDAMRFQHPNFNVQANGFDHSGTMTNTNHFLSHHNRDKKRVSISITSLTNEEISDPPEVAHLSIQGSPTDQFVRTLSQYKPSLPSLSIRGITHKTSPQSHEATTKSPALSRYAISPQEANPSQTLARIQSQPSPPSVHGSPAEFKQTLPSLETALSCVSDIRPPYTDPVSAVSRRSPNHLSPYGLSPPTFTQNSPAAPLSPPRFSNNAPSWRTLSQNSSNSTMSEYASAPGSTPASSTAQHSPSHSAATPQYPGSEHESSSSELTPVGNSDSYSDATVQRNGSVTQGFVCQWPGCSAPPFQTQYLLNSHTNVHSTTRSHFCPVKECPRGPGGQGFKRKNEMIRHGLVHQSPGYICPFCVDQQHRYPRPDNLQRHVRVHHVDKDRDDPALRDVLAQRPEGGNRGRRRRLGS